MTDLHACNATIPAGNISGAIDLNNRLYFKRDVACDSS